MMRKAVRSSTIASVGYDVEGRLLEVEFHSGDVYQYQAVPPNVYDALMRAASVGKTFDALVKRARYRFTKLR
jgi:hypothetical protein